MYGQPKNPRRQAAGAKGGRKVVEIFGVEHMREIGRKGGRPRLPTLEEMRAKNPPPQPASGSLRDLKKWFRETFGKK
ncbi:hypothetical protein [Dehalogenimonas etheniformans]|uniref:Uncharacterized protein n=1 Tax=Dehalogenimonas etheniformans TaxID=1536648 RepID=A0A2P5P502_9CHLR|nr:hypothetical protein [Dehalogenimonas etheniformans]PPD57374.1 hypothetical protein JP09_010060 [Dehalogenimonas etheniformans]QNT75224.1 hypothetical protein HX448_00205 [Dehalogenimonas etheniformans]